MSTTFRIECPCGCGETVTATDAGFDATTVEAVACTRRRAEGIVSVEIRKSVAYQLASTVDAYRHKDGLVTFEP